MAPSSANHDYHHSNDTQFTTNAARLASSDDRFGERESTSESRQGPSFSNSRVDRGRQSSTSNDFRHESSSLYQSRPLKSPPVPSYTRQLPSANYISSVRGSGRDWDSSSFSAQAAAAANFAMLESDEDSSGTFSLVELLDYDSSWSSYLEGCDTATYFTEDQRSIATEPNVIAIGVPKPLKEAPSDQPKSQEDLSQQKVSEVVATDLARKEHSSKVRRSISSDEVVVERKPSAVSLSNDRRSSLPDYVENLESGPQQASATTHTRALPDPYNFRHSSASTGVENAPSFNESRFQISALRKTHSVTSCSPPPIPTRRNSTDHCSTSPSRAPKVLVDDASSSHGSDDESLEGESPDFVPSSDQSVATNSSGIDLDEKTRANIVTRSTSMLISRRKRSNIRAAIQKTEGGLPQNADSIPCRAHSMPSTLSFKKKSIQSAISRELQSDVAIPRGSNRKLDVPPRVARRNEESRPTWCDEKQKYRTSSLQDGSNHAELRQSRHRPCDEKQRLDYDQQNLEAQAAAGIPIPPDVLKAADLKAKVLPEGDILPEDFFQGETGNFVGNATGDGESMSGANDIEAQAGVPVVLPGAFSVRPRNFGDETPGQPSSGYDSGFEDEDSNASGEDVAPAPENHDDVEDPSAGLRLVASDSPVEAELYEVNYAAARVLEETSGATDDGKKKRVRVLRLQLVLGFLCCLLGLAIGLATMFGNASSGDDKRCTLETNCGTVEIEGWTLQGDVISGPTDRDRIEFGNSVSLSSAGTRLLVGLPGLDGQDSNGISTQTGGVHVLDFNGTAWSLNREIKGSKPNGRAGTSVVISDDGSRIAFGVPNSADGGCVLIYEETSDGNWEQVADLNGDDGMLDHESVSFGSSLAFSYDADIIAIGDKSATLQNITEVGMLMVFKESNRTWSQLGDNVYGDGLNDLFSWSVGVSDDGTRLAASALGARNLTGQVRFYDFVDEEWMPLDKVLEGGAEREFFGASISMAQNGDRVAVGATGFSKEGTLSGIGRVSVYDFTPDDQDWQLVGQPIDGSSQFDRFGSSVSLSQNGTTMAIGSPESDLFGEDAGTVRVVEYLENDWEPSGSVLGRDGSDGGLYGFSVDISGNGEKVVAGAPQLTYDGKLSKIGEVWVFEQEA